MITEEDVDIFTGIIKKICGPKYCQSDCKKTDNSGIA